MKNSVSIILLLFTTLALNAQVLNGDFEDWIYKPMGFPKYEPTHWNSNLGPDQLVDSVPGVTGLAIKLETKIHSQYGFPTGGNIKQFAPIDFNPSYLQFDFQAYRVDTNDMAVVYAWLEFRDTTATDTTKETLAIAQTLIKHNTVAWDQKQAFFDYTHPISKTANMLIVYVVNFVDSASTKVGSELTVDNISVGGVGGIDEFFATALSNKTDQVKLYDLTGKLLYKGGENTPINLPKGLYIANYFYKEKLVLRKKLYINGY